MSYLLDTNACIAFLRRGESTRIARHINASAKGEIYICAPVCEELLFGVYRSANVAGNLTQVRTFLSMFTSLPFDDHAAELCAIIRSDLEYRGLRIGTNDALIAGIAMSRGLTLVTHNVAEFSRVDQLQIVDWQSDLEG